MSTDTKPVRVQLSRRKGWRMPLGCVKVDRATKWGSPYVVGEDGTLDECINKFRAIFIISPLDAENVRRELRGKSLACWCKPGQPCHADVLLEIANSEGRYWPRMKTKQSCAE
jgi:hypothetical protein